MMRLATTAIFASAVSAVLASAACGRSPCNPENVETTDKWCVIPITCPEGSQPSLHHERCELPDGGTLSPVLSGEAGAVGRGTVTNGQGRAEGGRRSSSAGTSGTSSGGSTPGVAGNAGGKQTSDDADAGMSTSPVTTTTPMDAGAKGPSCGNGVVEPGETCDGNCRSACPPPAGCVVSELQGSATHCDVECVTTTITATIAGDGCCPDGANASSDGDCPKSCGDGIVQAPETCETPSKEHPCPTLMDCDDNNPCTKDALTGSATQCNAQCVHTLITAATNNDQCCPSGANANTDNDCTPVCGNNAVEPGELCDGSCPKSCSGTTGCSRSELVGSAEQCSAACMPTKITATSDGDGCCPDGANANNDSDCRAVCGNGVRENSEICDGADCPRSCDDGNPCTSDELIGASATCNAVCKHSEGSINACGGCGPLEHPPGATCSTTRNSCTNAGKYECQGAEATRCNAATPSGTAEKCDGSDNDCDGKVDEGVTNACGGCTSLRAAVGASCLVEGVGCANQGRYECDGANALRCNAAPCLCGNGIVDSGEACDVGVPGGNPGSCPTNCNDGDPCTNDKTIGSLCTTTCLHVPMGGVCKPKDPDPPPPAIPSSHQ